MHGYVGPYAIVEGGDWWDYNSADGLGLKALRCYKYQVDPIFVSYGLGEEFARNIEGEDGEITVKRLRGGTLLVDLADRSPPQEMAEFMAANADDLAKIRQAFGPYQVGWGILSQEG